MKILFCWQKSNAAGGLSCYQSVSGYSYTSEKKLQKKPATFLHIIAGRLASRCRVKVWRLNQTFPLFEIQTLHYNYERHDFLNLCQKSGRWMIYWSSFFFSSRWSLSKYIKLLGGLILWASSKHGGKQMKSFIFSF